MRSGVFLLQVNYFDSRVNRTREHLFPDGVEDIKVTAEVKSFTVAELLFIGKLILGETFQLFVCRLVNGLVFTANNTIYNFNAHNLQTCTRPV